MLGATDRRCQQSKFSFASASQSSFGIVASVIISIIKQSRINAVVIAIVGTVIIDAMSNTVAVNASIDIIIVFNAVRRIH